METSEDETIAQFISCLFPRTDEDDVLAQAWPYKERRDRVKQFVNTQTTIHGTIHAIVVWTHGGGHGAQFYSE